MFRYFLSFGFVVSFVSAATIQTEAVCDYQSSVGTLSASCNFLLAEAQAKLEISGPFSVFAEGGGSLNDFGIATANFSDDYIFTVNNGTGNGSFFPCFAGGGGGTAMMSFDGIAVDVSFRDLRSGSCTFLPFSFAQSKPFIFGVPQIVHITMYAYATQVDRFGDHGMVSESLDHILFFDPAGNVLQNVNYTLVSVDLPEPSAVSLLGIGLMFCLAVHFVARRD
jgi:hypothetical protein